MYIAEIANSCQHVYPIFLMLNNVILVRGKVKFERRALFRRFAGVIEQRVSLSPGMISIGGVVVSPLFLTVLACSMNLPQRTSMAISCVVLVHVVESTTVAVLSCRTIGIHVLSGLQATWTTCLSSFKLLTSSVAKSSTLSRASDQFDPQAKISSVSVTGSSSYKIEVTLLPLRLIKKLCTPISSDSWTIIRLQCCRRPSPLD